MAIDEKFIDDVKQNSGGVVIIAGSDSDKPHIDKVVNGLKKYEIPFDVRISSAHKQPGFTENMICEYNRLDLFFAYVIIAGGNDALSGVASYLANRPVISCPPDAPNDTCLKNPPGSSNAYIARPENAARFIAQMFSCFNAKVQTKLEKERVDKINKLFQKDEEFNIEYRGEQ